MGKIFKPIVILIFVCIIVLFLIFCIFIWKPFSFPMGVNLHEANWLDFWGNFLGFIGTSALGLLALWQNERFKKENDNANARLEVANQRAYELNKELLKLQKQNHLSVIRVENGRELKVYAKDKGSKFINKLNEKNTILCHVSFTPKCPEENDYVLFEIYIKNITNNFVKHIELEAFELKSEFKDKGYRTSRCNGDADTLIAPFETYKLLFIIANLNTKVKEQSINEYLENMFDFKFTVSLTNLYGDITKIKFDLFAECGFEDEEDVFIYALSCNTVEISIEENS